VTERVPDDKIRTFLRATQLRILWEKHHGNLTPPQRAIFESRPEIAWLVCIPSDHVKPALRQAKKLQRVLFLATRSHKIEQDETDEKRERELHALSSQAEHFRVTKPKNPNRLRLS